MEYRPHGYQQRCIEQLTARPNLGLFLDMGLGKTSITLHAILELKYRRFAVSKVLIIAPKKVTEATWQDEAKKWDDTKALRIATVLGSASQRARALNQVADVYIINRENVVWLVEHYKQAWPFDMVVIDESSGFKSRAAKRFKALAAVRPHIARMVCLTGTPSPNSLMDLWAQIFLLDGGERLGRRFTGFRERYFDPGRRNGYVVFDYKLKPGAERSILDKISDICLSMKAEDYLELPECVIDDIPVVLDGKAQKAYNTLEREMVLELDSGETIDALSAAAVSGKLLQLAGGAVYDDAHSWHEVHSAKIEALLELIEQLNGSRALVFYSFQHEKARILAALAKTSYRVRCLSEAQDQADWNAGRIDILLAHPASAAYGLNLQYGGNHIIWFGLTWNYELYEQANKRLHRQGQQRAVIVHRLLVKGSRDEDVKEALSRKADAQDYVLESLKARIRRYRDVDTGRSIRRDCRKQRVVGEALDFDSSDDLYAFLTISAFASAVKRDLKKLAEAKSERFKEQTWRND